MLCLVRDMKSPLSMKKCRLDLYVSLTYYVNCPTDQFCQQWCILICCLCLRSHLQVSFYRLCELSFDTAIGHALYVSDNRIHHYHTQRHKSYVKPVKPSLFYVFILLSFPSFLIMCFSLCPCRENLLADCLQGCFVVTCTLCAFISLVWLREQIVHGGAPQWLEQHQPPPPNAAAQANEVHCFIDYKISFSTGETQNCFVSCGAKGRGLSSKLWCKCCGSIDILL